MYDVRIFVYMYVCTYIVYVYIYTNTLTSPYKSKPFYIRFTSERHTQEKRQLVFRIAVTLDRYI